jgi:hypothetical protein
VVTIVTAFALTLPVIDAKTSPSVNSPFPASEPCPAVMTQSWVTAPPAPQQSHVPLML